MAPTLINVDVLPGDDMSPEAIRAGASRLRAAGDKAFADGADVVRTWRGIAAFYVAPESGELVAAMSPVKTSGATFDRNLCSAADALDTFAEAVRAIKKTCEGIRAAAKLLLAQVDANGKVGAGVLGPGSDWYHDPVTSGQNDALIAAVAQQAALLKTAERACAGAIEGLAGGGQHGEHGGPGFATAPQIDDQPWGHTLTRQDVLDVEGPGQTEGTAQQSLETLSGFLQLVGFDTSGFDASTGRGRLFGHWSVHNVVTNLENIVQAISHHPVKTATAMFKDLTAWDDWHDHPGFALGKVEVNALLLGVSFLKVGSLAKAGSAGREAADAAGAGGKAASEAEQAAARASRLARAAEIGQRAGHKAVVASVDGLKDLAKAVKADRVWEKTLDRLDKTVRALHHDIDVDHGTTTHPAEPRVHEPQAHPQGPTGTENGHAYPGEPTPRAEHPTGDADTPSGQHGSAEVSSTDVDPRHHVVHDGWTHTPHVQRLAPGLADARIVKQAEHLDALHRRDALARTAGVDPKDLTVANAPKTLARLEQDASTPAELRRVRELEDAVRQEYLTNRQLHRTSERMGTEAGLDFHASRGEDVVVGDHDESGKRNRLDTVGINGARTVLDVVEEKGGSSDLGTRKVDGVVVEQGSTVYLNKLMHLDPDFRAYLRKNPDVVPRLLSGDMELQHHVVYAKPDGTVRVERMRLNPDELHLEDLLPVPDSGGPGVSPPPAPVPAAR